WTYTLDQSAVQNLDAGDVATDTITYTATDGTAQQITVTINGSDDASVVAGTFTDTIIEGNIGGSAVRAAGVLSISDVDDDDAPVFEDQARVAGDNRLGSFSLNDGVWGFVTNQRVIQDLDVGDSVTDTAIFTATDGTEQHITVTINGSDDVSVVAGIFTDTVGEGNVGDAAATAAGTLSISDVDGDDNPSFADQASTVGDNAFGSFALAGGAWVYTLDQNTVQSLDAGDVATDTITYTATDGTAQQITVTINGSDDASIVAGTFTDDVAEGNVGDAAVTATGTLSISDVDGDDAPAFNDQASTAGDNALGSFALIGGNWTYTLDQSAVQNLDAGDVATDTITYTATDGTAQQITVTINGSDDASVVAGTFTDDVAEGNVGDAAATATGTLSISDADGDDSPSFNDQTSTAGDNALGSFALTGGNWTYTLDQSAVQNLDAGDVASDTITYTATDGTAQQITVTINGSDDASVVAGTFTDDVAEGNVGDAAVTANGTLSISDVDADDAPVFNDQASTSGDNALGSFVLSSGNWIYTLDQNAVQNLDAGDVATDTITYTATDGTAQQITVSINGSDDVSVVAGTFTDDLAEGNIGDAAATATGALSISDLDADDVPVFNDQASTVGDNALGSFALTGGTWIYTLDQSAVQNLDAGDVATDTITYTATDGTDQQITVTINGTSDASVVAGTFTDTIIEGNIGDPAVRATGLLSISDVDDDDAPVFEDQARVSGDNRLGSFVLNDGVWVFITNQRVVQDLDVGDFVTDTAIFTATDGTEQHITVTINGSDDASVVAGTFTDTITEGNVGDAAVTATGILSISDVDGDDSPSFADQASTVGDNALGSFDLTGGNWIYTLDQNAVQNLDAGDVATDTITYIATDGSTQEITVTINGSADGSVIAGIFTDSVAEGNVGDTAATAEGTLSISDVDDDDSPVFNDQLSTVGDSALGSFVLTGGIWVFTLDQSAVQGLNVGDVATDTITYTATDGSTQEITVTINGADEGGVVAGSFTDSVTEANIGDAAVTGTGTISISNAGASEAPVFNDQASTTGDNALGSFVLTGGTWVYTLDQSAVQDLDAGDVATDTITYTATDGAAQEITITINGSDDAAIAAGTFTDSVAEGNVGDVAVTATGGISISDVDGDDTPLFNDQASTVGDNALGSFVLTSGTWVYTLDQSSVQDLDAGDISTDTITYTATDGTAQQITVTINGSDDAATVVGTFTDTVAEGNNGDPTVSATGALSISDLDGDDVPAFNDQASTVGDNALGSFSLTGGVWVYILDQSTVQNLDAGDVATDTITYTATDGTTQEITVTINGSDDAAVIAGTFTDSVAEGNVGDAAAIATGTLSISDVDGDDSPVFNDQASAVGDSALGSFALTGGSWVYTLDQSAVQDLDTGDIAFDTITYIATDGTAQEITVTINGSDDAAIVGGTFTDTVAEGDIGDPAVTASGTLSISDADADSSPIFNDQASTIGDNAYGSFVLVSGVWTYILDQSTVQNLSVDDTVEDQITLTASDGTTQQLTVSITGTNDVPTVTPSSESTSNDTELVSTVNVASDVDGSVISYSVETGPADGLLDFNDDGSFSFDPGTDFDDLALGESRDVNFTYVATDDANENSDAASVTITVESADVIPEVVATAIDIASEDIVLNQTFDESVIPAVDGGSYDDATGVDSASLALPYDSNTLDFNFVSESAGFNNSVGWYQIDANGVITDVQYLWENSNSIAAGAENISVSGVEASGIGFFLSQDGFDRDTDEINDVLAGGGILRFESAPGVLSNISDTSSQLVYYSEGTQSDPAGDRVEMTITYHAAYPNLNSDGLEHVRSGIADGDTQQLVIAFEDLTPNNPAAPNNGPDWDLRDLILSVEISSDILNTSDIVSSVDITDNGIALESATVQLDIGRVNDILIFDNDGDTLASSYGISSSYDSDDRLLSLSGDATIAQYEEVLAAVRIASYETLGSEPRELSYTVTDSNGNVSELASVNLNVDAAYLYDENDFVRGEIGDPIIGGIGDDILIATTTQDQFVWRSGDDNLVEPATDTVVDFSVGLGGDVLDLSDLLQGVEEVAATLDDYLSFSHDSGTTSILIDSDAAGANDVSQTIVLQGVDLSGLGTDTQIIEQMLLNGNLNTE
ncbi:MAG: VCBS repeat-containing protein, partial [Flavobacteriales bacterium]